MLEGALEVTRGSLETAHDLSQHRKSDPALLSLLFISLRKTVHIHQDRDTYLIHYGQNLRWKNHQTWLYG